MIILSIETSCDETAVAIVEFKKEKVKVLANIVSSQIKAHSKFGGVVPALAARMHLKNMVPVLNRVFKAAGKHTPSASQPPLSRGELFKFASQSTPLKRGINYTASQSTFFKEGIHFNKNKIDYIAVTKGPGLIPALMVGVNAAKSLSYALNKPLVGVNHLEGHIYANWLRPVGEKLSLREAKRRSNPETTREEFNYGIATSSCGTPRNDNFQANLSNYNLWQPEFPVLCLIVSGGHTQLILMKKDLNYKIIGETLDDAAGEAFDKVAKLLGLEYPGGPMIEKMAKKGDKNKFNFPRPMMNSKDYNFSFSGLKTAVLYKWNLEFGIWNLEDKKKKMKSKNSDVDFNSAKSHPDFHQDSKFKSDIAASFQEAVIDVLVSKTIRAAKKYKVKNILLGGGVSANKALQRELKKVINKELPNSRFQIPDSNLSTDNALMIAIAAHYNIINNKNIKSWKNVKADPNLRLK